MVEVRLLNEDGDFLQVIKVKNPARFIFYYGRLFEHDKGNDYIQRAYLEIY